MGKPRELLPLDKPNLKVLLANFIGDEIVRLKITQKETAERLGISQPRLSNLLNRKMENFSVDFLIDMIFRLGYTFKITPIKNEKHRTEDI